MEPKHIVATDTFRLDVYTLNKETKALLALAAKNLKTSIEQERAPEQKTITVEQLQEEQQSQQERPKREEPQDEKNKPTFQLFDEEELLARYHRVPIYRPIVTYISQQTGEVLTTSDIKKHIKTYYEQNLKRKLSDSSVRSYASAYIRYYKEHLDFQVQEDGRSWRKKGTAPPVEEKIEEEQTPEEEEIAPRRMENKRYQYAHQIYETMVNGEKQTQVTIEQIKRATGLEVDQIERGLSALVEQNLATQMPRGVQLRKV